jgi:hypothetical protein
VKYIKMKNNEKKFFKMFIILGIVISFFLPGTTSNAVILNTMEKDSIPLSYEYIGENELIVTYDLQDLIQDQVSNEIGVFTNFIIPNSGFLGVSGKPQLPVVTYLIAVPMQDVSLKIIDTKIDSTTFVDKVYPAQLPQADSDMNVNYDFVFDEEFYQQDIDYPGKLSNIVYSGNLRDISFVKIEFYPVQYNPKQKIVTIYDEITIGVSWDKNEKVSVESDFHNSHFFNMYENTFSNWQGFLSHTQFIESSDSSDFPLDDQGCDLLIITHPDFFTKSNELANWKESKGFITNIIGTDEVGGSSNDIINYIQNAYDTWEPRPSYVLLVGDNEYIPTSKSSTDIYYVTVDGSDYYPDICIGRIPADSAQEANIMIQKILNYEQNPPSSEEFYDNFVVAAYFQDDENNGYETRRFVRTSEEVRDYLITEDFIGERIYVTESYIDPTHYNNGPYGDGEPLPEELLRPNFAWDGNSDDIINAIENGVFILNHRDHGFADGWGDPYFDSNHVHDLTNGELLPVVFSLNCQSGQFDNYECFCEEFVRQEGGGAIASFGASRTSYSGYNDYLCRGFYDCQWPEFDPEIGGDTPMYTLGQILNYGKTYMAETWGDPWGYERITFEMFHCFGDPTMEIWSAYPADINMDYTFNGESLEMTITGNDIPIENALVCLSQETGFYTKGYTDGSGMITIDTTSAIIEEEVILVISAHNYKTYFETFVLNQPPLIPDTPEGPDKGILNRELTYSISTTDPEGDQVFYQWSWGDGYISEWEGPYNSGETATASHRWKEEASYYIKVKAKDIYDQESDWSEKLRIKISENRALNYRIDEFLQLFSRLFPISRLIFRI